MNTESHLTISKTRKAERSRITDQDNSFSGVVQGWSWIETKLTAGIGTIVSHGGAFSREKYGIVFKGCFPGLVVSKFLRPCQKDLGAIGMSHGTMRKVKT
jgi:hypothetical protein